MRRRRSRGNVARGIVALALVFVAGAGVGRLTKSDRQPPEYVSRLSVSAADNRTGAVRASTRRLRIEYGLGNGCRDTPDVHTTYRETPTTVRVLVTLREAWPDLLPEWRADAFCGERFTMGHDVLNLRRPLGTRRVVNLAGSATVTRRTFDDRRSAPMRARAEGAPVLRVAPGRTLRVVLRTDRRLPAGLRLQLDNSRAVARLRVLDARRHCYVANVRADGDAERSPQLLSPKPGHHPIVSLLREDGRSVHVARGEVSGRRTAAARIAGARELGGLACRPDR